MEGGQPIRVEFSAQSPYFDKKYSSLFLIVSGWAEFAPEGLMDSEPMASKAESFVKMAVSSELNKIGATGVIYDELQGKLGELAEKSIENLKGNRLPVTNLQITSIVPNELSQKTIDDVNKMTAMGNMTQEEIAKKAQEAQMEAIQALAAQAQTSAAPSPMEQALEEPAASVYPKFCPNCGTPTTGGNFCGECGYKLR